MKIRVKLKRKPKSKYEEQYDWNMLKDVQIREKYNIEVYNRFQNLNVEELQNLEEEWKGAKTALTEEVYNRFQNLNIEELQNLEEEWKGAKTALTEAGKNTVPVKQRKGKQSWMTNEILEMIDKRKQSKNNDVLYAEIDRYISRKCKLAEEKWCKKCICMLHRSNEQTSRNAMI